GGWPASGSGSGRYRRARSLRSLLPPPTGARPRGATERCPRAGKYDPLRRWRTRGATKMTSASTPTSRTVLLYSDDEKIRERMRLAVGTRPAADLKVTFLEDADHRV